VLAALRQGTSEIEVCASVGAETALDERTQGGKAMRVFVAGATGAIGSRLVPQLVVHGHEVVGTSRSQKKVERLRTSGVEGIVVDLLDSNAVMHAVGQARPDAIIHEATALSGLSEMKHFDRAFAETNQLRTLGTEALLAAAREHGIERFVAQSFAGWPYAREGGPIKTEEDPLDPQPAPEMQESLAAIRELEQRVLAAGGIVLRYGGFYGSLDDAQLDLVRRRRFPIVGDGEGVLSFIHLDDAATATVLALERGKPGIYNVVDDEPAPAREWLPVLAETIGAKPPRHIPRWLAHMFAGDAGIVLLTEARGASNAKAKRKLGWTLRYPSWREGFRASYVTSETRAA
jgi:2-alkyl-3-oxoalkanoate reductase